MLGAALGLGLGALTSPVAGVSSWGLGRYQLRVNRLQLVPGACNPGQGSQTTDRGPRAWELGPGGLGRGLG